MFKSVRSLTGSLRAIALRVQLHSVVELYSGKFATPDDSSKMYFPTVNKGGQDMFKTIICVAGVISLSACSGLRTTDNSYEAHAENFNILFLQIPGGDTQERALKLVPKGGEITTMNSMPNDLTSVISVINRIIGIDITTIDGTISKK